MAGLSETDGKQRRSEEFAGIKHSMQHPDRPIPNTIHNRERQMKCIEIQLSVEIDIPHVCLTDADIVGRAPPFLFSRRVWDARSRAGYHVAARIGHKEGMGRRRAEAGIICPVSPSGRATCCLRKSASELSVTASSSCASPDSHCQSPCSRPRPASPHRATRAGPLAFPASRPAAATARYAQYASTRR